MVKVSDVEKFFFLFWFIHLYNILLIFVNLNCCNCVWYTDRTWLTNLFFLFKLTNHLITQWVWNKIESHLISSFLQRRMNSKSQGLKIAAYPINCTTQNLKLRWQYKTLQTLHHGDIQTKKSIVTRKFVLPLIILII